MSQPVPDPAPLRTALARTRLSVLILLAAAGAVMVFQPAGDEAPLSRGLTAVALALAVASIAARHASNAAALAGPLAVALALASLLLALAIGALGLWLTLTQSARETGLLLAFGGFILATPRPRLAALDRAPQD